MYKEKQDVAMKDSIRTLIAIMRALVYIMVLIAYLLLANTVGVVLVQSDPLRPLAFLTLLIARQ